MIVPPRWGVARLPVGRSRSAGPEGLNVTRKALSGDARSVHSLASVALTPGAKIDAESIAALYLSALETRVRHTALRALHYPLACLRVK